MDPTVAEMLRELRAKLHHCVEIEVKTVEGRLRELKVAEAEPKELEVEGKVEVEGDIQNGPVSPVAGDSQNPEDQDESVTDEPRKGSDAFKEMLRRQTSYGQASSLGSRIQYGNQRFGNAPLGTFLGYESCMQLCRRVADSPHFDLFWALVITSNAAFLGIQLEIARDANLIVVHVIYAVLFAIELSMRLVALGPRSYFLKPGWAWNWLDAIVVISAWANIIFEILGSASDAGVSSSIRLLNLLRVSRLLRIVKTLWLVRFVGALRTLVTSLVDTFRQLFWAMLLLLIIIYIAGVLFTDVVLEYTDRKPDPNMQRYFGSIGASVQTLFRAISGGFDWAAAADALRPLGAIWVQLFHFYVGFCTFAALNVMTGCFCESAIKAAEKDHENRLDDRQDFREVLVDIFNRLDDGDGRLTLTEFESAFENETMQAFLETAEITALDAWTLFANMDVDGNHVIDVDEFTKRCLSLRGAARSMDVFTLTRHNLKMREQLTEVQRQLSEVTDMLTTSHQVFPL